MSPGSQYSRIHRLINDSIPTFTGEPEVVSLTREQEKELLASLSQILKQLMLWSQESNSESGNQLETPSDDHLYLSKIVADTVSLLVVRSHYVQHLAANILVVISKLLATFGTGWDHFICSLCCCMELALANILSFSSTLVRAELRNSKFNSSSFTVVIKPRLKNAGWSSLAGIVRVLRNILKFLKQNYDYDDNLTAVYVNSVHSCLLNVPWDSMDAICGIQSDCSAGGLVLRTVDEEQLRVMFLGNFIQLLCSLIGQSSSMDGTGCSFDNHPILSAIANLVPNLLYWCLAEQGECVKTCVSQYFRHKLLVLMIRLSFEARLDCCILISWLQLLHNYFQEPLQLPITQLESIGDDCLEGSPFLMSVIDGESYSGCSRHLQRQAIFLFVRCSLTLVGLRENNKEHCASATADTCLTFKAISDLDFCGQKKGLLEFHKWLQRHLPVDVIEDYEIYMEKCINFSSSFIQLYIHEDDILFSLLLQLLNIHFCGEQRFEKKWISKGVEADTLFHLSHLFNPVLLFHLVLAELHYDHQVLLDYLISKDTGIHCAEYLLRCLRVVCNSWPLFKEFFPGGKATNQSAGKRRKVILDNPNLQDELPSPASESIVFPCLDKECTSILERGYEYKTRRSSYKEAKECLLSLKTSVENLHQKNLFLYNPVVLLNRCRLHSTSMPIFYF